jgi:hypothetical protein
MCILSVQLNFPELYRIWRCFDVAHIDTVVLGMYNKLLAFMTPIRTLFTGLVCVDILTLVGFAFD